MFHKAVKLNYREGTVLEVTFRDGVIKQFDVAVLFDKYPQLKALKNRDLFLSGRLMGAYGIVWNENLDLETATIYEEGVQVGKELISAAITAGDAVAAARAEKGLSQKELAKISGVDQSDISKIERGVGNPSVNTLSKLARAMDAELVIHIK